MSLKAVEQAVEKTVVTAKADFNAAISTAEAKAAQAKADAARAWGWVRFHWYFVVPVFGLACYFLGRIHG